MTRVRFMGRNLDQKAQRCKTLPPWVVHKHARKVARQTVATEHTGVALLESRWWAGQNTSVAPVFDLLSDVFFASPHQYHYEMVNSREAAIEAFVRIAGDPRFKVLYLAAHGEAEGLAWHNGDRSSAADLQVLLSLARSQRFAPLAGLYLSACYCASADAASALLSPCTGLTWVAGYNAEVDWLSSTALDMLFFRNLLCRRHQAEPERIAAVADDLTLTSSGLIRELGFSIYVSHRGTVRDLLA